MTDCKKRVTNHLSVSATEMLAILLALQWRENKKILSLHQIATHRLKVYNLAGH